MTSNGDIPETTERPIIYFTSQGYVVIAEPDGTFSGGCRKHMTLEACREHFGPLHRDPERAKATLAAIEAYVVDGHVSVDLSGVRRLHLGGGTLPDGVDLSSVRRLSLGGGTLPEGLSEECEVCS